MEPWTLRGLSRLPVPGRCLWLAALKSLLIVQISGLRKWLSLPHSFSIVGRALLPICFVSFLQKKKGCRKANIWKKSALLQILLKGWHYLCWVEKGSQASPMVSLTHKQIDFHFISVNLNTVFIICSQNYPELYFYLSTCGSQPGMAQCPPPWGCLETCGVFAI